MSLDVLWEQDGLPAVELPEPLRGFYGSDFGLARECVYANFVETLDGVVAIPDVEQSNALVADGSDDDKHLMGLLRAFADAVLIGSGTLRASPKGRWRPDGVYPAGKDAFAELRARLGKTERATVAVVTTGVSLDTSHPVLAEAVVLTTDAGAALLGDAVPNVVVVNEGAWVDLRAALGWLRAQGHAQVLAEAGPTTFGELVAAPNRPERGRDARLRQQRGPFNEPEPPSRSAPAGQHRRHREEQLVDEP
ncbi:MAG TPA: dihydrofolate reductase family protein, partial [Gaiellaceae bacterium]|nr:dihydrofolate reductase family protein [Gaiellaceae bacterium]